MNIMIANKVTGEVVENRTFLDGNTVSARQVVKSIRGYVRQWMKDGLSIHQLEVLKSSSYTLSSHIQIYAWERMINKCDVCGKPVLNMDMVWCDDSEGICLVTGCSDCMGGH